MEKKVRKIALMSDPEATYFLQITWDKDFGKGFSVTLCDGHSAWIGEVPEEDITREATDMEMDRQKYVDELEKALIWKAPPANKYNFDLVKHGKTADIYSFTYEKKLKELSFKLGSLLLTKSQNPAGAIREMISYCLNCTTDLYSQNDHLRKENERLQSDWKDMHEQLEKFVSAKEELEQDLFTKFTHVLNEKKAKIRSIKERIEKTQQTVQQSSDNCSAFDTVPVSELKEEDYGGSTDEESKDQGTKEQGEEKEGARRRSVVSTPDDSPDIAPSRKKRQRGQKSYYTEVKAKKTEAQEKPRCNPAPSKKAGKTPSSERPSLETSKSTPDPDDLFSDI
ncbi:DNA repair protein XRCC4 isoform 2-T2 [Pelodytes ibericus]